MRSRFLSGAALAALMSAGGARFAAAQMSMVPGADGALVRAEYLRDLAVLERKYIALAEAFPPSLFEWRPAAGIRSVHEVVAVVTAENAALVPATFGRPTMEGVPGALQPAIAAFTARDRDALLAALRTSFAYARAAWSALSDTDLDRTYDFFGMPMTAAQVAITTMTDQHEHLGQLIAYARMNGIVPPWSARNASR